MEHTEVARLGGIARAKKMKKSERIASARHAGKIGGRGRPKVVVRKKKKRKVGGGVAGGAAVST